VTQYKEGHKTVLVFSNSRKFSCMALYDVRLWLFKAQFLQWIIYTTRFTI